MKSSNDLNPKVIRKQKNEFLQEIVEFRPDLYRFCRRLTNHPFDAEDLVQETLVTAYGKLADKHAGIENFKSYLFKMAANQWMTWCRRKKIPLENPQTFAEPIYADEMLVVQDSLSALLNFLPPKERVAFVLSEVFESKNEEIALIMGNTEGAVKSALVRAREKVKRINDLPIKNRGCPGNSEQSKILNRAVEAFNRRDIDAFASLFAMNAVGNAPGCFFETSAQEIKRGSLFYTVNRHDGSPQPESMRAQIVTFNGEALFALFDNDTLDDIWKLTIEDNEILRFDCYYCCPDVLNEIAESLKKVSNSHGYWFEQNLVPRTNLVDGIQ